MSRITIKTTGVAIGVALLSSVQAANQGSLSGWSAVEIRHAVEAIEERWDQLQYNESVMHNAPDAFARAEVAVNEALEGRRWNDDRERVYTIYQARKAMDRAELAARNNAMQAEIEALQAQRDALDARRIEVEAERKAQIASAEAERRAAEMEARLQAREAELARQERELAAREAALARDAELQATARADAAEDLAAQTALAAAAAEQRAAALEGELANAMSELEFERTMRGPVLVLGDVLFEVDGADLKPGAEERLDTLYAFLSERPDIHATVEGHTDNTGADQYNLDLSQRRADSVRDYLLNKGLDPAQVEARGLGEDKPVATNDTAEGRQQNRRVEILFTDTDDKEAADPAP